MATTHAEPVTVGDRFADVVSKAAHVTHEARLLKTLAADAVEDGVHAAKRAVTRGAREFDDIRETTAYRIKKAPFAAVGLAALAGLLVGMVCGRWGRCASQSTR